MTNQWTILFVLAFSLPLTAGGQTTPGSGAFLHPDSTFVLAWEWNSGDPQEKNSQDYRLYRQGYESILREDWEDARKRFAEISTRYSSSEYADDAAYWSAYALMHLDSIKAARAYRDFLKKFPRSRYITDAVSDYALLEARANPRRVDWRDRPFMIAEPPAVYGRRFFRGSGSASGGMTVFSWNLTLLQRPHTGKLAPAVEEMLHRENVDPVTRARIEELASIPDPLRDQRAFTVVKEVSVDLHQPKPVRCVALRSLADFRDFDVLPVYLQVVRRDTSPEIRFFAIRSLGEAVKDSSEATETLIHFYRQTPDLRAEDRRELIGVVASAGDNHAMEFLTTVARTEADPTIRISAIEGLGRIPRQREKSLDVLIDLYEKSPRSRPEVLSTTLFSAAEIGNDRAVDFLSRVARTERDPRLRGEAVFYLSTIGGEKARATLRQILMDR